MRNRSNFGRLVSELFDIKWRENAVKNCKGPQSVDDKFEEDSISSYHPRAIFLHQPISEKDFPWGYHFWAWSF